MKICLLLDEHDRKKIAKHLGAQGADFQFGLGGLLYATGLSLESATALFQMIGESESVPVHLGNEAALQLPPPLACAAMEAGIPAPAATRVSSAGDRILVELRGDCVPLHRVVYGCFIKNLDTGEYQLMSESADGAMEAWEFGLQVSHKKQAHNGTVYDRKDVKILAREAYQFCIETGWRSLTSNELDVLNYKQTFQCPDAIRRLGDCHPVCNADGEGST